MPNGNAVHATGPGGGWDGTGRARAGIFGFFTLWGGDTTGPENQDIRTWFEEQYLEYTSPIPIYGEDGSGPTMTYGRVWYEVRTQNVSESRWGTPSSDKWASTNGCYGGLSSSAYCEYDRDW